MGKAIEGRPKLLNLLNQIGWECEGAVINRIILFIMVALASWACLREEYSPQPLARDLGKITAQRSTHSFVSARLLQGLVDSEALSFANRSICDPVFQAREFRRFSFTYTSVCVFV